MGNPAAVIAWLRLQWWWPLPVGMLVGLTLRLLFSGGPLHELTPMLAAFMVLVPVAVGSVTVYGAELRQRRTWGYYFGMGATANVLFVLGTYMFTIEGLICSIIAAPLFAVLGGVAGILAGAACRLSRRWTRPTVYCLTALPLLLGSLENQLPLPREISTAERSITIAAAPDDVWVQLTTAPRIRPEEVADGWMYRIGVPLPESAITHAVDGEVVRHIRMGKGIQFDQVAADWEPGRRVRWLYRFTPDSFPPRALDDHVRIGGEYFDVIDTVYALQPRADGTTVLHVAMSYRVSTRFNWYAGRVAELLVGNFEETALRFYARRAQAEVRPAQREL
jgi:hypothetical protein